MSKVWAYLLTRLARTTVRLRLVRLSMLRSLRWIMGFLAAVQLLLLLLTQTQFLPRVFYSLPLSRHIPDVWTQLGLLLANVAIFLAEHHFGRIAKSIEDSADKAETRLVSIAESITSRCISEFPGHIQRITDLVSLAKTKVLVLADCVDYGSFRDFDSHERLLEAICAKGRDHKEIHFLVWDDPQPMSRANRYRDDTTRSDDVTKFRECIDGFLSKLSQCEPMFAERCAAEIQTVREFASDAGSNWSDRKAAPIKSLLRLQLKFHDELQLKKLQYSRVFPKFYKKKEHQRSDCKAPLTSIEEEHPLPELFFWIVDDAVAIFILPYHGEDAIAFETRDPALIKRLVTIFEWRYSLAAFPPQA